MVIKFLLALTALAPALAQAEENGICAWSKTTEKIVVEAAASEVPTLSTELSSCVELSRYFQSLLDQNIAEKSTSGGILVAAAAEKTSALRVIWILDKRRAEFLNETKTATYNQLLNIFEKGMNEYLQKLGEFNEKRLAAISSQNPQAVLEWQFMGQIYQEEVNLAASEWISKGYKNETFQLAELAQTKE